jgi:uncharacterized protein (TIGR00730 family)
MAISSSLSLDDRPIVTLFGSGAVDEKTDFWKDAEALGTLLAEAGYHICNGGYGGTMEASAKGAAKVGGTERIGILCNALADARTPNEYLTQTVETDTIIERLGQLTELPQAFIALPGSIGTVIEMMLTWNYPQVRKDRPLILMGAAWQQLVPSIIRMLNLHPDYLHIPLYCVSPEEALRILNKKLKPEASQPTETGETEQGDEPAASDNPEEKVDEEPKEQEETTETEKKD